MATSMKIKWWTSSVRQRKSVTAYSPSLSYTPWGEVSTVMPRPLATPIHWTIIIIYIARTLNQISSHNNYVSFLYWRYWIRCWNQGAGYTATWISWRIQVIVDQSYCSSAPFIDTLNPQICDSSVSKQWRWRHHFSIQLVVNITED